MRTGCLLPSPSMSDAVRLDSISSPSEMIVPELRPRRNSIHACLDTSCVMLFNMNLSTNCGGIGLRRRGANESQAKSYSQRCRGGSDRIASCWRTLSSVASRFKVVYRVFRLPITATGPFTESGIEAMNEAITSSARPSAAELRFSREATGCTTDELSLEVTTPTTLAGEPPGLLSWGSGTFAAITLYHAL